MNIFRYFFPLFAVVLCSSQIDASVISQFGNGVVNTISDDSAEFLINRVGADPTVVDVGDVIIAIAEIQTIEIGNGAPTPFANEFTALIAIEITGKTGGGGPGLVPATFTAGALSAGGLASVLATNPIAHAELSTFAPGSLIGFYDGGLLNDFSRTLATTDLSVTTAINGTKFLELGFAAGGLLPGLGEFYNISALTDDIGIVGSIPGPSGGGSFSFGLNTTFNPFSLQFSPLPNFNIPTLTFGASEIVGAGLLFAPPTGVTTPFDTYDNFEAAFMPVPEPSSLLVFAGVFSCFYFGNRRRR